MPNRFLLFMLFGLFFFTACEKKSTKLIGTWQSEILIAEAVDSNNNESISNYNQLLTFYANGTYSKNYITGNWSVNGRIVEFIPNADLGLETEAFKIKRCNKSELILEIKLKENEFTVGFENFEEGERIVIQEFYKKE